VDGETSSEPKSCNSGADGTNHHNHERGGRTVSTRDTDKHADGTIESLRTVVHTIKEYALPELPLNEKGQMPFMRAIFESVVAEVEASIARQETDKEAADANERYIAAIPALCSGEAVPCALHVSQPINTLRSRVEALEGVVRELVQACGCEEMASADVL